MMHFHDFAQCRKCKRVREYTTPIADIVVKSSQCQYCGAWEMIGIVDETWPTPNQCPACQQQEYAF